MRTTPTTEPTTAPAMAQPEMREDVERFSATDPDVEDMEELGVVGGSPSFGTVIFGVKYLQNKAISNTAHKSFHLDTHSMLDRCNSGVSV